MTTIKEILERREQCDPYGPRHAWPNFPPDIDHLISLLRECKPYVEKAAWVEVRVGPGGKVVPLNENDRALLSKLEDL